MLSPPGQHTPTVCERAWLSFGLCSFSVSANSKEADHNLCARLASGYQRLPRHALAFFIFLHKSRTSLLIAPGTETTRLWASKPLLPRLPAPKTLLPDALCSAGPTDSKWSASPQPDSSPCPLSLLQPTRLHHLAPVRDHKPHQHSH